MPARSAFLVALFSASAAGSGALRGSRERHAGALQTLPTCLVLGHDWVSYNAGQGRRAQPKSQNPLVDFAGCMLFGEFQLDAARPLYGNPTWWRHHNDSFLYFCNEDHRLYLACGTGPYDRLAGGESCQGCGTLVTSDDLPDSLEPVSNFYGEGKWEDIAGVPLTTLSFADLQECSFSGPNCINLSQLPGILPQRVEQGQVSSTCQPGGDYRKDTEKLYHGYPTYWSEDGSKLLYYCSEDAMLYQACNDAPLTNAGEGFGTFWEFLQAAPLGRKSCLLTGQLYALGAAPFTPELYLGSGLWEHGITTQVCITAGPSASPTSAPTSPTSAPSRTPSAAPSELPALVITSNGAQAVGTEAAAGADVQWPDSDMLLRPAIMPELQGGKLYFLGESKELPPGTTVHLTCNRVCDFFFFFYNLPGVTENTNGGLPLSLSDGGWDPRSCAPQISNSNGSCSYPMVSYHKRLVQTADSVEINDQGAQWVAVVAGESVDCNSNDASVSEEACLAAGKINVCAWSAGSCSDAWCPRASTSVGGSSSSGGNPGGPPSGTTAGGGAATSSGPAGGPAGGGTPAGSPSDCPLIV